MHVFAFVGWLYRVNRLGMLELPGRLDFVYLEVQFVVHGWFCGSGREEDL